MAASADPITLRRASPEDAEYIYRLAEESMRAYVEATWGAWNESASRGRIDEAVASGKFLLIYFKQALAGALQVEHHPTHIQLEQLYVEPSHQRRGIGTRLVEDLVSEAKESDRPVRLRVLKANPARAFYGKLGFFVTEATSERYFMEYQPRVQSMLEELGIPRQLISARALPVHSDADELVVAERGESGRGHLLIPAVAAAWRNLKAAAQGDSVDLQIASAFRSFEHQAEIVREKLQDGLSIDAILRVSAPPGFSEHHTGRAVDVTTPGCPPFEGAFAHTEAFRWLSLHAKRFGFTLSYPEGNPFGYAYEPWHWCFREAEVRDT